MRVVLTNFGSTGSVYPFISTAVELQRNGHEPLVALSPFFASWAARFGVEFVPIGPDLRRIQYDINEAMLDMPDSEDAIREMFSPLMPALPQMFEELSDVCGKADALVSGPWQPSALMIHELTGIPLVTIQNSHFGGGGTPAFQRASAALINPFRAKHGLPPLRNPLTTDANSPQLVLYNMSRHVRPPLPDWPLHFHMPGYLFLDDHEWEPSPELAEFIAQGPFVVVSFGSMTHGDPRGLTELAIEAVTRAGCRAIIQQGWSGLSACTPPQILLTDFMPHNWLFPRAACIVHHGGAGTAASVFRSGAPSVFVPHTFDHPLWAELAHDLGCAGPIIPFLELTAERLAAAIAETRSSEGCRQAAAELGRRIREEQGLRNARTLIEDLVFKVGLHPAERAGAFRPRSDSGARRTQRALFQQRRRLRSKPNLQ